MSVFEPWLPIYPRSRIKTEALAPEQKQFGQIEESNSSAQMIQQSFMPTSNQEAESK
jgi:hypothetical protein